MARGHDTRTTGQRARFLEHLANSGNVTASCAVAGIDRCAAYRMKREDEEFSEAWKAAMDQAVDTLEAEAWRRGRDGYDEYVTCKDGLVLDEEDKPVLQRRYSDSLLTTLLKAHRPEKYRDRSTVDMNVNTDIAALIDEGRRRARGG
ncbi:hypothetical protein [Komagataeibacter diospyri]|uniref:hypothetical protein n=1 Tax=Komagataeibacter diospyri TaxID=1932662 RepID=UPI003757E037